MTADKRKVSTDALETLGSIIGDEERRDAIHLAVEPAVAAHTLRPGEDVGFIGDGTVGTCDAPVGIVDPFLKAAVKKGERFWLVVYPRQITSLRHVWTHPAFAEEVEPEYVGFLPKATLEAAVADISKVNAQDAINRIAESFGVEPEELMERAEAYLQRGDYWVEGGRFEGEYLPDEFWNHYEVVTDTKVPNGDRGSFFSCSC